MEEIINKFPEELKNTDLLTAAEMAYDEGIIGFEEFKYLMKYLDKQEAE